MSRKNKNSIRSTEELLSEGLIAETDFSTLKTVEQKFSVSVTDQMIRSMDRSNPKDPIALQFVPTKEELHVKKEESDDPIGDCEHAKIPGIIHRYPDRCLLLPLTLCPVYCRFCFRREKVSFPHHALTKKQIDRAIGYITEQPKIWEVILSGGDPLFMSIHLLANILQRLALIKHVEILRIHTRVPVVAPQKINQKMIDALKVNKPVYIVLHSNHANEFNEESIKACARLVDNGMPMLSQTVLLKGINDHPDVMKRLMRTFVQNRIKPYYLHQADMAQGTSHFRTTVLEGQELMKTLRGHLSGVCQPTYVLDVPGGYGKVPINHQYIHTDANGKHTIEDYQGQFHVYPPMMEESNDPFKV